MSSGQPVTYKVTAVSADTQVTPQNTVIQGKRVTIETSTGYTGTMFIPGSVFGDVAAVKQLIQGEVQMIVNAQSITGQITGP